MSNKPRRVQRKRQPGYKMPANTKSVARPGKFGNPYVVDKPGKPGDGTAQECVDKFRAAIERGDSRLKFTKKDIPELRGYNQACFCDLDQPCHADVLLELANRD